MGRRRRGKETDWTGLRGVRGEPQVLAQALSHRVEAGGRGLGEGVVGFSLDGFKVSSESFRGLRFGAWGRSRQERKSGTLSASPLEFEVTGGRMKLPQGMCAGERRGPRIREAQRMFLLQEGGGDDT